MNCNGHERDIALLVSGDLPVRKAHRIQQHLAGCNACRRLETQLREDRESLRALRDSSIDNAARNELHERVLAATTQPQASLEQDAGPHRSVSNSRRHPSKFRLAVAYAGLAAAIVGLAAIAWTMREPGTPLDRSVQTAMTPPSTQEPLKLNEGSFAETQVSEPPIPVTRLVTPASHQSKPSVTVRLYTNDPRVVIFLVSDQTGG